MLRNKSRLLKRSLLALAAVAACAVTLGSASDAQARHGCGYGGGYGVGYGGGYGHYHGGYGGYGYGPRPVVVARPVVVSPGFGYGYGSPYSVGYGGVGYGGYYGGRGVSIGFGF